MKAIKEYIKGFIIGIVIVISVLWILILDAFSAQHILKWSDEFDYIGAVSDEWIPEVGYIRNEEKQKYTDDLENLRVDGEYLIIQAKKEGDLYASGSIKTKKSFWYGRIEVRAKLPQGRGVWPAFWTTGVNYKDVGWPACGEIDIMEYVGKYPHRIYSNVHYGSSTDNKIITSIPIDFGGFHIYAIEWTKEKIDFYIDGNLTGTHYIESESLRLDHIIRLNFALGGTFGGEIDDSIFPQQYVIDYVRVYELLPSVPVNINMLLLD